MPLCVGRDEHPAMGDADDTGVDDDLDGLPGEPHPDRDSVTGEADLAVAADLASRSRARPGSTGWLVEGGSATARRNRSHGATIPMP